MKRILLFLLLVISFQSYFSQKKQSSKYKLIKLECNTILSEITTQVRGEYLYVYRNKAFYKTHSEYYDLYKIKVNKGEVLSRFTKLDNDLNTRFNEGPVSFDDKNKLVYVTRNIYSKKEMILKGLGENPLEIDIYEQVNDTFLFKKKFKYNDENISIGHACYSKLTHRLYFSAKMKMKGARGGADLYYCSVLENGEYGPVVSLGKKINTKKDELFTMVNKGVLFYSTAGFNKGNRKDLDIFYIKEIDLFRKKKPVKLAEPFNSKQDDFGITFIDGQQGYLTSNRNNKQDYNHDIYYFDLGDPIVGDNEFNLLLTSGNVRLKKIKNNNFKIVDKLTRKELKKMVVKEGVMVERPEENRVYEVLFNEELNIKDVEIGPYKRKGKEILLRDKLILEDRYVPVVVVDTVSLISTIDEMQNWFDNNKDSASSFALSSIYFDYNKATISSKSTEILNTLAEYLNLNTSIKLKIYAHSDSRGSAQYNLFLSDRRANSVSKFLIDKGVAVERILEKKGLGETELLETCIKCTEEQHERNRRVEFAIVN